MLVAFPTVGLAATVTNRDAVAYTLVVTEGGQQLEIEISAGDTIEICPTGCFVVMPNGDREVLTGPERLEIESGRGKIF
jgi:hypothetical protein